VDVNGDRLRLAHTLAGISEPERPVSFWRFAGSVLAGQLGALGARAATRHAFAGAPLETRVTAGRVAGISAFWLIGGLTWVATSRRAPT
jgi:hypothetical protein